MSHACTLPSVESRHSKSLLPSKFRSRGTIATKSNVAVTSRFVFMLMVHGFVVPAQFPLGMVQPANVEPAAGVTVSVTVLPIAKSAVQVAPQLIPEGDEVTVPEPAPAVVTLSVLASRAQSAVTVFA